MVVGSSTLPGPSVQLFEGHSKNKTISLWHWDQAPPNYMSPSYQQVKSVASESTEMRRQSALNPQISLYQYRIGALLPHLPLPQCVWEITLGLNACQPWRHTWGNKRGSLWSKWKSVWPTDCKAPWVPNTQIRESSNYPEADRWPFHNRLQLVFLYLSSARDQTKFHEQVGDCLALSHKYSPMVRNGTWPCNYTFLPQHWEYFNWKTTGEYMIKARAHKGAVRIGKTPKKLASICCP
jgi:hypothetical protein